MRSASLEHGLRSGIISCSKCSNFHYLIMKRRGPNCRLELIKHCMSTSPGGRSAGPRWETPGGSAGRCSGSLHTLLLSLCGL